MESQSTLQEHRLRHAAGRRIGWTLFMALLTTPFGGYLYLGRVRRAFGFVVLIVATAVLSGMLEDALKLSWGLSDIATALVLVGAMGDLVRIIRRSRRELRARGLPVVRAGS